MEKQNKYMFDVLDMGVDGFEVNGILLTWVSAQVIQSHFLEGVQGAPTFPSHARGVARRTRSQQLSAVLHSLHSLLSFTPFLSPSTPPRNHIATFYIDDNKM